jgi:hypothetical protein
VRKISENHWQLTDEEQIIGPVYTFLRENGMTRNDALDTIRQLPEKLKTISDEFLDHEDDLYGFGEPHGRHEKQNTPA